jgi:transposase-like protein
LNAINPADGSLRLSKLAVLMDNSEADVLAFMGFPKAHRPQIHSTNPLERLIRGGSGQLIQWRLESQC